MEYGPQSLQLDLKDRQDLQERRVQQVQQGLQGLRVCKASLGQQVKQEQRDHKERTGPAGPQGPAGTLPTGMTFDGTTLTVPKISTTELLLTGGTAYSAGNYLATFDSSNNLTYTPYVPSSGGGSTVIGATIAVTSSTIAAYAEQSKTYTLTGLPAPGTPAVVFVNPSIDFGSGIRYSYRTTAANTITLKLTNVNGTTATVPAFTLYISAVH